MLKFHNSEMTEEVIREMSHEDLVESVIRLINVEEVEANDWNGAVFLPDSLADAFRKRNAM